MPIVVESFAMELDLELVHVRYDCSGAGVNTWFEYSPVTGLPAPWLAPGQVLSDYYQDDGAWRFFTDQGNADSVYQSATWTDDYQRPDNLPGWSWSLADLPDFPAIYGPLGLGFLRMDISAHVIGGGGALVLGPGATLTEDFVTLKFDYGLPLGAATLVPGVGYNDAAGVGRHKAWTPLVLPPSLGPIPVRTTVAGSYAVREADYSGAWMNELTGSGTLYGAAISPNKSLGFRIQDTSLTNALHPLYSMTAMRHWTVSTEVPDVATALLESAGEASSGVAMRVSALPATPELAMHVADMVAPVVVPVRHPILDGPD